MKTRRQERKYSTFIKLVSEKGRQKLSRGFCCRWLIVQVKSMAEASVEKANRDSSGPHGSLCCPESILLLCIPSVCGYLKFQVFPCWMPGSPSPTCVSPSNTSDSMDQDGQTWWLLFLTVAMKVGFQVTK